MAVGASGFPTGIVVTTAKAGFAGAGTLPAEATVLG
jgi:hypothetical protein